MNNTEFTQEEKINIIKGLNRKDFPRKRIERLESALQLIEHYTKCLIDPIYKELYSTQEDSTDRTLKSILDECKHSLRGDDNE